MPQDVAPTLDDVASGQKLIIYSILVNFVAIAAQSASRSLSVVLSIGALVLALVGLFRLASGLGYSTPIRVLLAVCMFLPLVNLITLLVLSSKATRALRDAGYKVGLMGATKSAAV
jgi:hypothetical membrane protein